MILKYHSSFMILNFAEYKLILTSTGRISNT